jgi:hypothetical protein
MHNNDVKCLALVFTQALLMDSGEWDNFVQQQFCLAEDDQECTGPRVLF